MSKPEREILESLELTDFDKRFIYHAPKEGQPEKYNSIRQEGFEFADMLKGLCPQSRELDMAIVKIEEAIMWANVSIARNE